MFSLSSSKTTDAAGHDAEQDRDLIVMINEARSPEALREATRTARARSRRRAAESVVARERRSLRRVLPLPRLSGARH